MGLSPHLAKKRAAIAMCDEIVGRCVDGPLRIRIRIRIRIRDRVSHGATSGDGRLYLTRE
jgi:hypothetical protein